MSSFTAPLIVSAVPGRASGWARLLPPGWQRQEWVVQAGICYAVGSLADPSDILSVPAGFAFDGASVPVPFRVLVPMAHPDYIQAAALHDWMLQSGRYSRRTSDLVFFEALGVLGMPALWRWTLFAAVRIGALFRRRRQRPAGEA